MATPTKETTSYTSEDEEAAYTLLQLSRDYRKQSEEEDDEVPSILLVQQASQAPLGLCMKNKTLAKEHKKIKKQFVKRKVVEPDDSEETRISIKAWSQIEADPGEIFRVADVAERFSEPIKKQLTESDVKVCQSRLMLGKAQVKKKMLPLLEETEIPRGTDGIDVSVYGPDGKVRKMMFKMWNVDTPVLRSPEWKNFVKDCGLKMHCDFLTIWMFRHLTTRKICFAIDYTRFPSINKPLSSRILKDVFPNPI